MTAFACTFADFKTVKTRSVAQVVLEMPIENLQAFLAAFGVPVPGSETWVGIARLSGNPRPPVTQGEMSEARQAVRAAALRCDDVRFQRWMLGLEYVEGADNEAATITQLRTVLGVTSRAEIGTNPEKLQAWLDLVRQFNREK